MAPKQQNQKRRGGQKRLEEKVNRGKQHKLKLLMQRLPAPPPPPRLRVDGCFGATLAQTIPGVYSHRGEHHGKPMYFRNEAVVGTSPFLFAVLYFWVSRNGEDLSGWWFGPQAGGDEVWVYNGNKSWSPPLNGWRAPWRQPVDPTMKIIPLPAENL